MGSTTSASSRIPELGSRGEGWVALQFALIAALLLCRLAGGDLGPVARWAGVALVAAGGAFFLWALLSLGTALTALPAPRSSSEELVDRGAFRLARHPIYGGGLLVALGFSLAWAPWGLVPTAALLVLFELKSRVEEAWLAERFAGYEDYRRRVRRRFLPWLL